MTLENNFEVVSPIRFVSNFKYPSGLDMVKHLMESRSKLNAIHHVELRGDNESILGNSPA